MNPEVRAALGHASAHVLHAHDLQGPERRRLGLLPRGPVPRPPRRKGQIHKNKCIFESENKHLRSEKLTLVAISRKQRRGSLCIRGRGDRGRYAQRERGDPF